MTTITIPKTSNCDNLLNQVLTDPQTAARAMTVDVAGPNGENGIQTFVRQPLLLNGDGGIISCQAPALGQHTAEVLIALEAATHS